MIIIKLICVNSSTEKRKFEGCPYSPYYSPENNMFYNQTLEKWIIFITNTKHWKNARGINIGNVQRQLPVKLHHKWHTWNESDNTIMSEFMLFLLELQRTNKPLTISNLLFGDFLILQGIGSPLFNAMEHISYWENKCFFQANQDTFGKGKLCRNQPW